MAGAPKHDSAADLAAITKVRDGYMAAFKAGNPAAMSALYAPDASSMENNQPTASGPQGIEAANKAMMDQMSALDITITPQKTEIDGDLAYEIGMVKTSMTPKAGGAPMTDEGRYMVVLKRQADNSWKLAADIGNSPTPAPAMMAPPKPAAKTPAKAPAKAPSKSKK